MKRSTRLPVYATAGTLAFFYLPLLIVLVNSFNKSKYGGEWKGFTFDWYGQLFSDVHIWGAFCNTLLIAVAATIVSTVLGTCAAFALHRYKDKLQFLHYLMIYSPLIVPDILMGMSLLLLFVSLKVKLGLFTIILAHISFCLSYVAMVVLGRLQDFDFAIVEAAYDLGASRWQAYSKVVVPVLAPGIIAGALFAFTLSIDDFVITFFVAGPGSTTLPIYIYSAMKHGAPAIINALSVVFLAMTFALVYISQRLLEDRK